MDMLAALRLQIEWGADEALQDAPVNRMAVREAVRAPAVEPQAPRPQPASAQPAGHVTPAIRARDLAAEATDLPSLCAIIAAFDCCPLAATATNMVFADGDPSCGLMVVGDVPGAEEDRMGRPFMGPPGQLLDRMMVSVGLDRTKMLLTNVIPWRPPGNRAPTDSEVQTCLPFLLRQIALARPLRLVSLGGLATHSLLATKGSMSRLRGRWTELTIPGMDAAIPVLPMLHPAYLMQHPEAKRLAWADLLALRRALDSIT